MPDDDDIQLPGEDEFYDLLMEAQTKAIETADRLGLSNEDLKNIESRWMKIGAAGDVHPEGYAVASIARHVLTIRRVRLLASMIKPDETTVPLIELADRFDKSGGGDA